MHVSDFLKLFREAYKPIHIFFTPKFVKMQTSLFSKRNFEEFRKI